MSYFQLQKKKKKAKGQERQLQTQISTDSVWSSDENRADIIGFQDPKLPGYVQVLGWILGKKQGLLRQTIPTFEESQN